MQSHVSSQCFYYLQPIIFYLIRAVSIKHYLLPTMYTHFSSKNKLCMVCAIRCVKWINNYLIILSHLLVCISSFVLTNAFGMKHYKTVHACSLSPIFKKKNDMTCMSFSSKRPRCKWHPIFSYFENYLQFRLNIKKV